MSRAAFAVRRTVFWRFSERRMAAASSSAEICQRMTSGWSSSASSSRSPALAEPATTQPVASSTSDFIPARATGEDAAINTLIMFSSDHAFFRSLAYGPFGGYHRDCHWRAATQNLSLKRLADRFRPEVQLHCVGLCYRVAVEREQHVSDDDSGLGGRSVGFERENHKSLAVAGQPHGVHADTEKSAAHPSLGQKFIGNAGNGRGGDCHSHAASQSGGVQPNHTAFDVDKGAAGKPGEEFDAGTNEGS